MNGYSLTLLRREIEEMKKDLAAFQQAYDLVRARLRDSNDLPIPRRPLLHEWSGSRAVCGSFEFSVHAIERTIEEMKGLIDGIEDGSIENTDPPGHPGLGVIDGGKR